MTTASIGVGVSTESVDGMSVVVLDCLAMPEGLLDFGVASARELARRLASAADDAERADLSTAVRLGA